MNIVFKALSDPTRRQILHLLRERGDLSAGEIAEAFQFSKATISHHLDLLKQANLVDFIRVGQYNFYALNMTVMDELMEWVLSFKNKK